MKKVALLAGVIIIITSCATKKINFDQLQDRNGLFYLVNDKEPFTGEIVSFIAGKVEFEGEVKNGLKEGLWIYYYPNGQKEMEGMYRDGLKEGTWSYWAENGEQENQAVYKMGTQLGHEGPRPEDDSPEEKQDEVTSAGSSGTPATGDPAKKSVGTAAPDQLIEAEPPTPKPLNWDDLAGGPVKFYQGKPYTGPVVKWYREGAKGKYLEGHFTNGHRSGKWTYYDRAGNVKDIRYY